MRAARCNLLESPSSLISQTMATDRIETLLDEQRRFTPSDAFKAQAHVRDTSPHERAGKSGRVALIWEGEPPGQVRRITYSELHADVNKFANVLKGLGVKRGDRVAIY